MWENSVKGDIVESLNCLLYTADETRQGGERAVGGKKYKAKM